MATMKRNGVVKEWKEADVEEMLRRGWVPSIQSVDFDALKKEAEDMGLKVHHKAGADKIKQLIEEAKGAK